jgi:hypothetical protein
VLGGSSRRDGVVAAIAHLGFGMGAGALFGMLHSKRSGVLRAALTGAGFGTAVWATSYYGWVPALGLMREPHDDRPFRPTAMVAGHIVYGSVLGAIVDGAAPSP